MVITAKFDSKCTRCFGRIFEGDRVIWNRGVKGVAHAHNCLNDRPITEGEAIAMEAASAAIEEPVTIVEQAASVQPVTEPVKAASAPSTLTDPRDPKELCAFLSSLTLDQLKALSSIVTHEISRRYERDEHKQAA